VKARVSHHQDKPSDSLPAVVTGPAPRQATRQTPPSRRERPSDSLRASIPTSQATSVVKAKRQTPPSRRTRQAKRQTPPSRRKAQSSTRTYHKPSDSLQRRTNTRQYSKRQTPPSRRTARDRSSHRPRQAKRQPLSVVQYKPSDRLLRAVVKPSVQQEQHQSLQRVSQHLQSLIFSHTLSRITIKNEHLQWTHNVHPEA
jgi:hypothetical protein